MVLLAPFLVPYFYVSCQPASMHGLSSFRRTGLNEQRATACVINVAVIFWVMLRQLAGVDCSCPPVRRRQPVLLAEQLTQTWQRILNSSQGLRAVLAGTRFELESVLPVPVRLRLWNSGGSAATATVQQQLTAGGRGLPEELLSFFCVLGVGGTRGKTSASTCTRRQDSRRRGSVR